MQKFVWRRGPVLLVAWVLILGFLVGDGSVQVFGHILPHNNLPLSSLPWQQVYAASLSSQRRPTYWKPLQLESMLKRHTRRHRHHHSRHGDSSPSLHPSPSSGSSKHRPIEISPAQAPNSRVARPPEPLRQRNPSPTFAPLCSPSSQPNIPVVPPSGGEIAGGFPPPSSSPANDEGCQQLVCSPPLTSTTFGSPCGCVLPMQIEINLGVASYEVLPLVTELEIEVAAATYLRQSQVRIMSADADIQDEGKTTVNIDLVPLGEKFDYVSALLIYQRFVQNKVAINRSLFGGYEVAYIRYPGLPSPLPSAVGNSSNLIGPGPTNQEPFGANVVKTTQKSAWRVAIITLCVVVSASSFLGVLALIFMVFKKRQNPPAAVQSLPPSLNKRSAPRSILSSSMASSTSVSLESSMLTYTLTVKTFTISELRKATNNFSMKNVVGEGGFGRVYLATLTDSTKVAVKVLTKEAQHGDREFIAEVEMLSRLHHRNLVKLIGICIEEHNRCLVYELVPNGSVESHLHGKHRQTAPLDWDARMKIALGTARGLAYLHEDSNPRVIHRDFKAGNVLLESDFTPKVSDFGLAREASDGSQHISTRVMGTFGYVAPEYAMTGHLLVKSDVYSYGVMLIELLSGRKPVDMSKPPGQENLVTWARPLLTNQEGLEQLVDHNLVGNCNFDNIARVAAIASMCVHPEVSQRPFMGEVVQALKLVYNEVDDTGEDCQSQRENSSCRGSSSKAEFTTENSWGHERVPCLKYGYHSSFITTMEYSSGRLDTTRRPISALNLAGGHERESYLEEHHNKSWPMQMVHQEPLAFRLRGSMSERGPSSRHVSDEEFWV